MTYDKWSSHFRSSDQWEIHWTASRPIHGLAQEFMEIRDSALGDAEGIAALIDSVARERQFLAATVGFSVDDTRAFIESTQSAGGVQVVGIESGEIVGWCDIVRHPFDGMR